MFSLETRMRWDEWNTAMSIIRNGEEMGFYRRDSKEEDALITEAHNVVLDTLGDADVIRKIEQMTGKDLRSQISIQEVEDMYREKELRGYGTGRN